MTFNLKDELDSISKYTKPQLWDYIQQIHLQYQGELSHLRAENRILEEQNTKVNDEWLNKKSNDCENCAGNRGELAELKSKYENLKDKHATDLLSLSEAEKSVVSIKHKYRHSLKEKHDLEDKVKELSKTIDKMANHGSDCGSFYNDLVNEIDALKEANNHLNEVVFKMEQGIIKEDGECASCAFHRSEVIKERGFASDFSRANTLLNIEIAELQEKLENQDAMSDDSVSMAAYIKLEENLTEKIQDLTNEKIDLQDKHDKISAKWSAVFDDRNRKYDEISVLKDTVLQLEKYKQSFRAMIELLPESRDWLWLEVFTNDIRSDGYNSADEYVGQYHLEYLRNNFIEVLKGKDGK